MSELTITHLCGNDTHGRCRLWRLAEPLIYEVGGRGSGRVILLWKGFITDGPSIPQFLCPILPLRARWSRPGVIHDSLSVLPPPTTPHPQAPTPADPHRIFLQPL